MHATATTHAMEHYLSEDVCKMLVGPSTKPCFLQKQSCIILHVLFAPICCLHCHFFWRRTSCCDETFPPGQTGETASIFRRRSPCFGKARLMQRRQDLFGSVLTLHGRWWGLGQGRLDGQVLLSTLHSIKLRVFPMTLASHHVLIHRQIAE